MIGLANVGTTLKSHSFIIGVVFSGAWVRPVPVMISFLIATNYKIWFPWLGNEQKRTKKRLLRESGKQVKTRENKYKQIARL